MLQTFNIKPVNKSIADHFDSYISALGLPAHSLGILEHVVLKLAGVQGSHEIALGQLQHIVFCGDHGAYDRSHQGNLSPLRSVDHVNRLLSGKAPVTKACKQLDVDLTVIDCGLKNADLSPQPLLISHPIANGTRDFSMMPAMSPDQLQQAIQLGVETASLKMAEGARVLSFGALGLGNTTSAAAITMAILAIPAETAISNQNQHIPMLNRDKIDVLTQSLQLHQSQLSDGWSIVQHLGGFEIAAIMGAMSITAELGGLFLVDGFACSAAILALSTMYPDIVDYAQFTHQSSHSAQHLIMKHLQQRPLLNLNLALGEGTGSVLSWPLIVSAVNCLKAD